MESVISMNNLFHPDSKLMQYGYKLFDLMSLQLAVMLFSLPVVTAGAAFTAMHFVLLRIYRDQSTSVWKEFISAFRKNFKQSTIIWILVLLVSAFLYIDYRLIAVSDISWIKPIIYLLFIPIIYLILGVGWVFVLQSRYDNSVGRTIKNALAAVFSYPFYTLINVILMATPLILLVISFRTIPLLFFLGFTLPGILRANLYSRFFDDLEGTNWRETVCKEDAEQDN